MCAVNSKGLELLSIGKNTVDPDSIGFFTESEETIRKTRYQNTMPLGLKTTQLKMIKICSANRVIN